MLITSRQENIVDVASALCQGLYQFLRPTSTSSPPLPRSPPLTMDYTTFGTRASPVIIPDDSDPSWWVVNVNVILGFHKAPQLHVQYEHVKIYGHSTRMSFSSVLQSPTCSLWLVKHANQCQAAVCQCSHQRGTAC